MSEALPAARRLVADGEPQGPLLARVVKGAVGDGSAGGGLASSLDPLGGPNRIQGPAGGLDHRFIGVAKTHGVAGQAGGAQQHAEPFAVPRRGADIDVVSGQSL